MGVLRLIVVVVFAVRNAHALGIPSRGLQAVLPGEVDGLETPESGNEGLEIPVVGDLPTQGVIDDANASNSSDEENEEEEAGFLGDNLPANYVCCAAFLAGGLLLLTLGLNGKDTSKLAKSAIVLGSAVVGAAGFVLAAQILWPDDLAHLDPLFQVFKIDI